ncbi:MAG: hypothetical protein H6706_30625 [Myxococcales bacterium]|nr:hypothetical protein [Myxococcales bacterium]
MIPAISMIFLGISCNDDTSGGARLVGPPGQPDAALRPDRGVDQGRPPADAGPDAARDAAPLAPDAAALDRGAPPDMALADAAPPPPDRGVSPDMAARDMALPPLDMAPPPVDMAPPPVDMAPPPLDMAPPPVDMAPPPPDMAVLPPGRRACALGPGFTLFAVHWSGGSSSARVDHWDASCEYSIRINDACGAFARCGDAIANCGVAVVDQGQGLLLDGIDDLLFRFNVQGQRFRGATLYFQARGTRGQAQLEIWSPLYGGLVGPIGGIDYEWYELDWSDFLSPGDDPGLTGVRFDAVQGQVAVHAVELCITE